MGALFSKEMDIVLRGLSRGVSDVFPSTEDLIFDKAFI